MIHEFIRAQNVPNDTVKDQPKHCGVCVFTSYPRSFSNSLLTL